MEAITTHAVSSVGLVSRVWLAGTNRPLKNPSFWCACVTQCAYRVIACMRAWLLACTAGADGRRASVCLVGTCANTLSPSVTVHLRALKVFDRSVSLVVCI